MLTVPHYPTPGARSADFTIHVVGLLLAVAGAATLLRVSTGNAAIAASSIYSIGTIAMLSFSLAYNSNNGRYKPLLRRLDHAGIFLMIAGSYTPFTTLVLTGTWAAGMTAAVWTLAGLGILAKLFLSDLPKAIWIACYLGLGWMVLVAAGPILSGLRWPAVTLLVGGGLVYTLGMLFYVKRGFRYSRPVWHGHVVAGAGLHWAAILIGAVLPATGLKG